MTQVSRTLTSKTDTYTVISTSVVISSKPQTRWDNNNTPDDVTYVAHDKAPYFSRLPLADGVHTNSSISFSIDTYIANAPGHPSSFETNIDDIVETTFQSTATITGFYFIYTSSYFRTGKTIRGYTRGGTHNDSVSNYNLYGPDGPDNIVSYSSTNSGTNDSDSYTEITNSFSSSTTGSDNGTANNAFDEKWGLIRYATKVSDTFTIHAVGGLGFVGPNGNYTDPSLNAGAGYKSTSFSMTSIPEGVWHSVMYTTMTTYQLPVGTAGTSVLETGDSNEDTYRTWSSGMTAAYATEYVGFPPIWWLSKQSYSLPVVTYSVSYGVPATINNDEYSSLPQFWSSSTEGHPTWRYPTNADSLDFTLNNDLRASSITSAGNATESNGYTNSVGAGGGDGASWGATTNNGNGDGLTIASGDVYNIVANWSKVIRTSYTNTPFTSITRYRGFRFGPIDAGEIFMVAIVGSGRNGAATPQAPLSNKTPEYCRYATNAYSKSQFYNPKFETHSKWVGNANLYVEVEVPSLSSTTNANGKVDWNYTYTGSGDGNANSTGIYRPGQGDFYNPPVQNDWFVHQFFSKYNARFLPFSPGAGGHSVYTVYSPFGAYCTPIDVVAEYDGATTRIAQFNPMETDIVSKFSSTFSVKEGKNLNILAIPKDGNAASFNAYYDWLEYWTDYEPVKAAAAARRFLLDPFPKLMPKAAVKPKIDNCSGGGGGGGGGGY
jgi:hypothetical protein